MTILGLILVIVLFFALRWLLMHLIEEPQSQRVALIILYVVAFVFVCWLLLGLFGVSVNRPLTR